MDDVPEYVVDPNMRFADIIVPTIDTVRAHFLLELLVTNYKPVSLTFLECDIDVPTLLYSSCIFNWDLPKRFV